MTVGSCGSGGSEPSSGTSFNKKAHLGLSLSSFYGSCCSNIEQVALARALLYVPITVQYVYFIVTAGNERGAFF
jgi:hypothetical protein